MSKTRQIRSLDLIANFVDGYAVGWHFKVGDYFKDQLDIQLTLRKEGGKSVMRWTHGKLYCFDIGHVIYSGKDTNIVCQVQRAVPNRIDESGKIINGSVTFTWTRFDNKGAYVETVEQYHLTQNDFVDYLKTGELKEKHHG